jgi:hypothetical protein
MNATCAMPVDKLAELAQVMPNWSGDRHRAEWTGMFESLSGTTVSCQVMEKSYLLDLYRARLESASVRGDDGLDGLDQAVGLLEASTESHVAFVLISWHGRGFFLWLNRDLSRLVAYWRAVDARGESE